MSRGGGTSKGDGEEVAGEEGRKLNECHFLVLCKHGRQEKDISPKAGSGQLCKSQVLLKG